MKVALVIHRFLGETAGGAEMLAKEYAKRLGACWDIEVVTTCAKDYLTWANDLPEGKSMVDGITVLRFPVEKTRDIDEFSKFGTPLEAAAFRTRAEDENRYFKEAGPYSPKLVQYLEDSCGKYDAFIFYTYLYYTTAIGAKRVLDKAFLITTAHDERPFYLMRTFMPILHGLKGIIFLSKEERDLVMRLYQLPATVKNTIAGYGFSRGANLSSEETKVFEQKYEEILRDPFFLYVGRVCGTKGVYDFNHAFRMMKDTHSDTARARLLFMGSKEIDDIGGDDVICLGVLPEKEKTFLIKHALALVNPSALESMSIVIYEAWLNKTPVLVNGESPVTKGLCERAQGGLAYNSLSTFQGALRWFIQNPRLAKKLGKQGYRYVYDHCSWDTAVGNIRRLVEEGVAQKH
ncbi:MAG: glycosyltransferase family 4 protein [Oligoflexales bacterium]